jgi:anaerobic selenocysteine-containing dehydrogenase
MTSWGGPRSGAGRKPTAQKYKANVNAAECKIAAKLPMLAETYLKMAFGQVAMSVEDPAAYAALMLSIGNVIEDGGGPAAVLMACGIVPGTVVYSRPPFSKALEYLLNRIMGKPTERLEVEWSQEKVEALYEAVCSRAAEVIDGLAENPETAQTAKQRLVELIASDITGLAAGP